MEMRAGYAQLPCQGGAIGEEQLRAPDSRGVARNQFKCDAAEAGGDLIVDPTKECNEDKTQDGDRERKASDQNYRCQKMAVIYRSESKKYPRDPCHCTFRYREYFGRLPDVECLDLVHRGLSL